MVDEGFVVHLAEEHRYGLGVAAFEVGSGYSRQEPLQRIARRPLADLVDRTGQSAHLAVLHGRDVLYVLEERAPGRPPLVTDVGVRLPAHLTASGRAILLALPAGPQVRALYPAPRGVRGPARPGPAHASARCARVLSETRQRGYATEDGEVTPGLASVAAAVARPQRPPGRRGRRDLPRATTHGRRPALATRCAAPRPALTRRIGGHPVGLRSRGDVPARRSLNCRAAPPEGTQRAQEQPGSRPSSAVVGRAGRGAGRLGVAFPSVGRPRAATCSRGTTRTKAAVLEALPHVDPPGTAAAQPQRPGHEEPPLPRRETGAGNQDPTTAAAEARERGVRRAASARTADPTLTTVPVTGPRRRHPQDRYAMANGCYTPDPRRRPAVLQADRARHLPALRRRPPLRERRRRHRPPSPARHRVDGRPQRPAASRFTNGRHAAATRRHDGVPAHPRHRLHRLPGVPDRHPAATRTRA